MFYVCVLPLDSLPIALLGHGFMGLALSWLVCVASSCWDKLYGGASMLISSPPTGVAGVQIHLINVSNTHRPILSNVNASTRENNESHEERTNIGPMWRNSRRLF